ELADELAGLIPGAAIATDLPEKFGDRLAVLWGSRVGLQDAGAISALSEKVVSLLQRIRGNPVDVTFVTRVAKSVQSGEAAPNLAGASLSALGLVAENEFDPVSCRSVDLPAQGGSATDIVTEIAAGSRGEIAWRGGRRFVNVMSVEAAADDAESLVKCSVEE